MNYLMMLLLTECLNQGLWDLVDVFDHFKKNGESFEFDYLSDKTPWEEIKKCFPSIVGCRFNGPMENEMRISQEIVIGGFGEPTRINAGWKHFYLDFGNHLVCKEEYYEKLEKDL